MKKSLLSICMILGLLTAAAAQQPGEIGYRDVSKLPEGQKGAHIRTIIDTLNANQPDRVRRFITEECTERFRGLASMERHIDLFLNFYQETGGLEFHSIREYTPERKGQTVVILKDRNFEMWRAFTVRFDRADGRVAGLSFDRARPPSNVKEPGLNREELLAEIENLLNRLCDGDVFSGSILVAQGDRVLYNRACGEASKRFHVPNNLDTRFNLGSMNKMFTSTAIMRLVEKGRLNLSDPISRHLDESWLPTSVTDRITVHHLLTHTSGLGSYFNEAYERGSRRLWREVEDYKDLVRDDEPSFTPGKRFRYSNTGMLLLGAVIESVTGGGYYDYIRENIYRPAGMTRSGCYEMDIPVENLAIGYHRDRTSPTGWRNNLYLHVIKGGPAGGGFSTVGDLHRFARALTSGKLVSKKSLETMWTDHAGAGYGYGFSLQEGPGGKVVGHGGGFSGINANLDIFLDSGYTVAVMSNISNGASPLARKLQQLIGRLSDAGR